MSSLIPKNGTIIIGILIAVMPFVGIPGSWKTPLYFLLGSAVAALSYQMIYKKKAHPSRHGTRKLRVHEGIIPEQELEQQPTEQPREDTTLKNS